MNIAINAFLGLILIAGFSGLSPCHAKAPATVNQKQKEQAAGPSSKSSAKPKSDTASSSAMMNIIKIKDKSAKNKSKNKSYLLTYSEIKKLKKTDRNNYLRSVSKALIHMSPKSKKTVFQILFAESYAREDEASASAAGFRCIGGGVPVPAGGECGARSYAGFTCDEGQEICNPFLFGVNEDNTPFCFTDATTELCYRKISPGKNSNMDLVFAAAGSKEAYDKFAKDIDDICYHIENEGSEPLVEVAEGPKTLSAACGYVRKQTQINRERQLAGYSEDEKSTKDDEDVILETVLPPVPAAKPESDSTVDDSPMDYNLF